MIYVLYFVHVVVSLFLILVVLLQQGKGADLSVFGGGASQAAFGARGAATLLHKLTVTCFVVFILTTLSIGIVQARGGSSVMGSVVGDAVAEEGAAAASEASAATDEAAEELGEDVPLIPGPADSAPADSAPADSAPTNDSSEPNSQ